VKPTIYVFTLVSLIGFAGGPLEAGDGGFGGVPLGIDLSNTSDVDYGWVRIADDDGLEPQTLTLEAWIHPLGNGYLHTHNPGAPIIAKATEDAGGANAGSWSMWWAPPTTGANSGKILVGITSEIYVAGTSLWSIGTIPMGTSAHVAMTFDGTWLRIFINGQLDNIVHANSPVIDYGNEDVFIGAVNFTGGFVYRFDGIIDEVRIWDHARDEATIAGDMDCPLYGDEPGLLAYYSFNMADATDDSGNGHGGLFEGNPEPTFFAQDCTVFFDDFEFGDTRWWSDVQP
jgi:hypothetical protein